jgi:hypothetical protein
MALHAGAGSVKCVQQHLAKAVELQAACADRIHDGGVVDDAYRDVQCARAQLQVCVCGCPACNQHASVALPLA